MELRQLRYFEALGSTLNFSRAAEQLNIAQPPLTRQIQQLEEELGVILVDRSKRPLRLTAAGAHLYEKAIQILSQVDEVRRSTREIGDGRRPSLRVGLVSSVLHGDVPLILNRFLGRHHGLEVVLSELTSLQQAQALLAGQIDVGLGRLLMQQDGLANVVLRCEALVAAVPADDQGVAGPVSFETLAERDLVIYPAHPRPSFADQVLSLFRMRGLSVRRTIDANGLPMALGLVAAGMGVAVAPASVRNIQRSDVRYHDITNPGAVTPLIMVHRQRHNAEEIDLLISQLRDFLTSLATTEPGS